MQTNPTWNEYLDLVKQECERRFDSADERFVIIACLPNIYDDNYTRIHKLLLENSANSMPYPYMSMTRYRSLHLQPRLDWLEGLKEK